MVKDIDKRLETAASYEERNRCNSDDGMLSFSLIEIMHNDICSEIEI
jgi:hypothetical protein